MVRGPRSSLYGSEAIGGVVQIFTRKSQATPTRAASASVGADDARGLTATCVVSVLPGEEDAFTFLRG